MKEKEVLKVYRRVDERLRRKARDACATSLSREESKIEWKSKSIDRIPKLETSERLCMPQATNTLKN